MAEDFDPDDRDALEQRLKSALWYAIGKQVDVHTSSLRINATPQFIGALSELVWAQIESAATDLEVFAKHAGRRRVDVADVMLLGRRNEGLEGLMRGWRDAIQARDKTDGFGAGKRKRVGNWDVDEDEDADADTGRNAKGKGKATGAVRGMGAGRGRGRPKKTG